jgi:hypothetical protein
LFYNHQLRKLNFGELALTGDKKEQNQINKKPHEKVYMNHGPEFWKLLDSVTKGRAKQLRKELRSYRWG